MSIKKLFLNTVFMLFSVLSYAAGTTYYMATDGNDSNDGSIGSPKLTLNGAFAVMSAGDILSIATGTYTGDLNRIVNTQKPPNGTAENWTIIKAAVDGEVVFDGESERQMFYISSSGDKYWQFEGIVWCKTQSSVVQLTYSSYVKFFRCGAYDAGNGNAVCFQIGRDNKYCLLENCYAWGAGRYKFISYLSNQIIFRTCVARIDGVIAGNEPVAQFAVYSSTEVEVQNCLALDADQTDAMSAVGEYGGCFYMPTTSGETVKVNWQNCIALNSNINGLRCNADTDEITFTDCVFWNITNTGGDQSIHQFRGRDCTVNHCTFGNTYSSYFQFNSWAEYGGSNTHIYNCIISSYNGHNVMYDMETWEWNCVYNSSIYPAGEFENCIEDYDPVWTVDNTTGALKYLVRIETSSILSGGASDSGDIGANVEFLIGETGTLYGETGYNTDTGNPMWPYPYETLISSHLKNYSWSDGTHTVTGDRGAAASSSLTQYVWAYLGNGGMPDTYNCMATATDKYGAKPHSASFDVVVTSGVAPFSYAWDFKDGSSSTVKNPSHTFVSSGTYAVNITVTDSSDPVQTTFDVVSIVVTSTPTASAANVLIPLSCSCSVNIVGGVSPFTYSWTTSDGGSSTSATPIFNFTSVETPTKTITCTVTDNDGETSTTSTQITYTANSVITTQRINLKIDGRTQ